MEECEAFGGIILAAGYGTRLQRGLRSDTTGYISNGSRCISKLKLRPLSFHKRFCKRQRETETVTVSGPTYHCRSLGRTV